MLNNNYFISEYKSNHKIVESNATQGAIFLGDINAALDIDFISRNNIKTVITAAQGLDQVKYNSDINHLIYPLLDIQNERISRFFQQNYKNIQQLRFKGNILIHCAAGISRSATLLIAYLMKKQQWTFRKAIKFVRNKRSIICPNLGFQRQLKQYQIILFSSKRALSRFEAKTSQSQKHKKEQRTSLPEIIENSMNKTQIKKLYKDNLFLKPIPIIQKQDTMSKNLDLSKNLIIQCLKPNELPHRMQVLKPISNSNGQEKKERDLTNKYNLDLKRMTMIKLGIYSELKHGIYDKWNQNIRSKKIKFYE